MNIGNEVYIKVDGEGASRWRFDGMQDDLAVLEWDFYNSITVAPPNELAVLKPTERLVSELPEIARMTGCYVAVDYDGKINICEQIMILTRNMWGGKYASVPISSTITCPNAERFDRQWGPDGEVI